MEKQVNLKEIINNAKGDHNYIKNLRTGVDSGLSMTSNISTTTERMKQLLIKSPIKIKGLGFQDTPYHKMLA